MKHKGCFIGISAAIVLMARSALIVPVIVKKSVKNDSGKFS